MILSASLPVLEGIAPLVARYDGFILDLWGVLHNGEVAFPGVFDALIRLREAGKSVCLLSNAPRRVRSMVGRMAELGFIDMQHYQHFITSGEATHAALRTPPDGWHAALGRRCFHLGPPRDRDVVEDLAGLELVERPAEAEFVVNTGIDRYEETLADHEPTLQACAHHGLPMLCANPDRVVVVGTSMVICAGTLAERYTALGGTVRYHGKPYPSVYQRCLAALGIADHRRILAVGDSLATDIAGANAAGIDSALTTGGIHLADVSRHGAGAVWGEAPDRQRLAATIAASGHRPDWVLTRFAW